MSKLVASIMQGVGGVALTLAGLTVSETVGLAVAGIVLVVFGVALERDA